MEASSFILVEGIIFLVIGLLFSIFVEKLLKFQKYTNKKLFDITISYTSRTIRIMRWFPSLLFVIIGVLLIVLSFFG